MLPVCIFHLTYQTRPPVLPSMQHAFSVWLHACTDVIRASCLRQTVAAFSMLVSYWLSFFFRSSVDSHAKRAAWRQPASLFMAGPSNLSFHQLRNHVLRMRPTVSSLPSMFWASQAAQAGNTTCSGLSGFLHAVSIFRYRSLDMLISRINHGSKAVTPIHPGKDNPYFRRCQRLACIGSYLDQW